MKIKTFSKTMSCILSACMAFSSFALTASATSEYKSETHDVFKHSESTLAPGVEQSIDYAYAKDGKQMVYYVTTADVTRDDVYVQSSYLNQHENGVMGMEKLTNQIAYANSKYSNPEDSNFISEYYNVVAGVNASFYNMTTGQPMGITYIDGVSFGTSNYDNFFAILKDGKTAVIDYAKNIGKYVDEDGNSTIWQAAAGSQWLVRDGEDVSASASGSYNTERHSRTCVGITSEGKVVTMVLDGRQEPFSCGGNMHELAQIMLEQGCVAAVNLDGGGSTTYAARQAGTDSVQVINRPSDGSERSISSGIIIASTAAPSNVFDSAVLSSESNYVTPNSTVKISAVGVSPAGTSADIPDDAEWQLADQSYGTVSNGVFTSTGKTGEAVVQMIYNGKVVGETKINVVVPTSISFSQNDITVPYGKSVSLDVTATYGLNDVTLKEGDIDFSLSDNGIGSIDGFTFSAGDGSVETSTVTAKVPGTDVQATAIITLGKGSEVIYDFEDGDVSNFDLGYVAYNYTLPEGKVYPVTKETGKVHSGNSAMALDINYGNSTESGYMMTSLEYKGGTKDFKNATKLGMWIYIPDEDVSTWIRYTVYPLVLNSDGEYVRASDSITNTKCDDIDSTTGFVNTFEESGWHYLSIDLSKYKGLELLNSYILQFYISDRDGTQYDYYYNQHKSYNGRYVFYVDDITVDYSSAVDDREAPVFSNAYYASTSMSDAVALDGQTVSDNTISFSAKVAENTKKTNYTGLDLNTAKAYVDGVEFPCDYSNGTMSVADVSLADGVHHVKFSICDKAGNYASIIRDINVDAKSGKPTVKVVAHDPTLDKIKLGSVWYADIVATDIEKVKSVEVDIDLNNMSKWELDHMIVASGFDAKYSIQDDENIATIKINRVGKNTATGEETLVSLPIRTWELKMGYKYTSGTKKGQTAYTYAQFKSMKEFWPVDISMEIDRGLITFVDNTTDIFTGTAPQVDTESYKMAKDMISTAEGKAYYNSWDGGHIHNAVAIADKDATCTETGYTGRTYCEDCNSVVDWGTTIPAKDHTYEVNDGVLKCKDCGELFDGEFEGKLYADGVLVNGWIEDSYYVDGVKLTGINEVEGYYYDFGDNGVCSGKEKYNGLLKDEKGLRYVALGELSKGWRLIGENDYYYFGNDFYAIKGRVENIDGHNYEFNDEGVLTKGSWYEKDGVKYYYWAGKKVHRTFFDIDGKTYYFGFKSEMVTGLHSVETGSNSGKSIIYLFGEDGALITDTGLHKVYDDIYYVNDGKPVAAGLVFDGTDYYYIRSDLKAVKDCNYYVWNNNGLMESGYYNFGEDGKMIIEQPKNGVVNENGSLYYYVNGEKQLHLGLIKVDDSYYYVRTSGELAVGNYYVWNGNGLMESGYYNFDEDGKMIIEQPKNGVVNENGSLYYYVNGEKQLHLGLIKVDDSYYYVRTSGELAVGNYYVWNGNGLMESGYYNFGEDGKMIIEQPKNGIVNENGSLYYYVNGEKLHLGLIKIDDSYYYVRTSGELAVGNYYVWNGNGLMESGYYNFGEDGKMIIEQPKNGIVNENGSLYYYVNGEKQLHLGLIKIDDGYYYVRTSGELAVGNYYVWNGNGLMESGYYDFDDNGRMINN